MKADALDYLAAAGVVSPFDRHFARFLEELGGRRSAEIALAAAMASSLTRQGHVCADLRGLGGMSLDQAPDFGSFPEYHKWTAELSGSRVVGAEGDFKPLILDGAGRLYLYRYWQYQDKLVRGILERIDGSGPYTPAEYKEQLDVLFPGMSPGEVDWQKISAFIAASKRFCVISGGPGTGKTTTVAKILALLVGRARRDSGKCRVALAAPTGKAAARLQEAISSVKQAPVIASQPSSIRDLIPESASTIHRLLGTRRGAPYFRFNEENRLPFDIVVVDEASMVDLALMSKLVQALPVHARLILLGDKDQLASVEAGAVLGDICNTGERIGYSDAFIDACEAVCECRPGSEYRSGKSSDCVVELQKSYRFTSTTGIGELSRAIRDRDSGRAISVLKSGGFADLDWRETPPARYLGAAIRSEVIKGFRDYLMKAAGLQYHHGVEQAAALDDLFESLGRFRILCALREGPYGETTLNSMVESILAEEGLIGKGLWYGGRPVIVRRNDYNLGLYNGDVGICLPDIATGGSAPRVFFPGSSGEYRSFHLSRLPQHETVYAMTIHKSQGSEFDDVLVILPDVESPVLSRALVYTGITRARKRVSLLGPEQVLRRVIDKPAQRLSGLSDALWGTREVVKGGEESNAGIITHP